MTRMEPVREEPVRLGAREKSTEPEPLTEEKAEMVIQGSAVCGVHWQPGEPLILKRPLTAPPANVAEAGLRESEQPPPDWEMLKVRLPMRMAPAREEAEGLAPTE